VLGVARTLSKRLEQPDFDRLLGGPVTFAQEDDRRLASFGFA